MVSTHDHDHYHGDDHGHDQGVVPLPRNRTQWFRANGLKTSLTTIEQKGSRKVHYMECVIHQFEGGLAHWRDSYFIPRFCKMFEFSKQFLLIL